MIFTYPPRCERTEPYNSYGGDPEHQVSKFFSSWGSTVMPGVSLRVDKLHHQDLPIHQKLQK